MILFLIYIFLKKYRKQNWTGADLQISKFLKVRFAIIFLSLLIILLSLIPILSKSQNQQLNYKIVQDGDDIGWLQLEKYISGNTLNLLLISEINTRFVFRINVSAKETSTFENGRMIFSSQFRKTNGTTKVDKQTKLIADKYEVQENGEKERLSFPFIGTNLLSLYFYEPAGTTIVYCDKHECFLKISKTDDGGYSVKFPDGNSNCYYYKGGICNKIIINHTFYSAEIILKP